MPDRGPCVQTVPQDNDRPLKWLKLQEFTYIDKSILCFLTEHGHIWSEDLPWIQQTGYLSYNGGDPQS